MSGIDNLAGALTRRRELLPYILSRESLLAAAITVAFPNILFLLISPWVLVLRSLSPVIYLLAALLALRLPAAFAYLLFFAASAADVFFIISFMFDMPAWTSLRSLRYFSDIDIAASAIYVCGIAYFIAMPLLLAYAFNRRRREMRAASLVPALVLAYALGLLDFQMNGTARVFYPEFESAASRNNLTAQAIAARDRNLLIVMVEGLGAYADPQERGILADRLKAAAAGRFRFSTGTSNHYGSTTGATSRELCGRWATFTHYLEAEDHDCLPERLARAGYRTASYHASYGDLFSRPVWYPRIGFQDLNFREDIERDRPDAISGLCGSVFPGLCDRDIGDLVHEDLLHAGDEREFIYWLTLNSHLPYAPLVDGPLRCRSPEAAIPAGIPCELTEIWIGVFDKVAEIARDPQMPPLDILVVGDHNTPMWSRAAAGHFIEGKVDWYFLEDMRPATGRSPAAGSD